MLKNFSCAEWVKDNDLILKTEIDSDFLILTYRLNQSFKVHGKMNT